MSQATRTAPASRLTRRRLMDSLVTYLQTGTATDLAADRTTASMSASTVQRLDPDTVQLRLPDGTKYQIRIEG